MRIRASFSLQIYESVACLDRPSASTARNGSTITLVATRGESKIRRIDNSFLSRVVNAASKGRYVAICIIAVVAMIVVVPIQGCVSMSEWTKEHHMRLYDRYRLTAHHDLIAGRYKECLSTYADALNELEQAKVDQSLVADLKSEMAGAYLLSGKTEEALKLYQEPPITDAQSAKENSEMSASALCGVGFCYLKLGDYEKATRSFRDALEKYKSNTACASRHSFPIDLCQNCCAWGLFFADSSGKKFDHSYEQKPLRKRGPFLESACLTSRLLLEKLLSPVVAVEHAAKSTVSHGTKSDTAADVYQSDASAADDGLSDVSGLDDQIDLETQRKWEAFVRGGQRAEKERDFAKAERYYKSAISVLRKANDKGIRLYKSVQYLGFLYSSHNKRTEAIPLLEEAVEIQRGRFGKDDRAIIGPLARLGANTIKAGKVEDAERLLNECLALCIRHFGEKHYMTAVIYLNIAYLRMAQHRCVEAEQFAEKTDKILSRSKSTDKLRLNRANLMIANALECQHKLEPALNYALRAESSLTERDPFGQLYTYTKIADLQRRLGSKELSIVALRKANRMYRFITNNDKVKIYDGEFEEAVATLRSMQERD